MSYKYNSNTKPNLSQQHSSFPSAASFKYRAGVPLHHFNSPREYLESCPNDRDVDTPVIKIRMGLEPPNFTGFFVSWDEER